MSQFLKCKSDWRYFSNYYGEGPTYICPDDRYGLLFDADAYQASSEPDSLTQSDYTELKFAVISIFVIAFCIKMILRLFNSSAPKE